jgi:SHS2 domain-containing protein
MATGDAALADIGSDGTVPGVRVVEHPADAAIEVEAASLDACLARAAAGMFALMFAPPASPSAERTLDLSVEADEPEGLLVAWLQELLYRSELDSLCFRRFEVRTVGRRLRGRALGVPLADVEAVGPMVKAVTYHGLRLGRERGRWRARVLLDV